MQERNPANGKETEMSFAIWAVIMASALPWAAVAMAMGAF